MSLKRIKKVIIGESCGQCAGNIGDEGILAAMLPYFIKIFNKADIKVIAYDDPKLVEDMHQVKTVPRLNLGRKLNLRLFGEILQADVIAIGGGTLIQEQRGHVGLRGGLLTHLSYVTAFAKLIARKPVMLIGIGVEPIVTKRGKFFVKHFIGLADIITVRDPESRKLLIGLGINRQKVKVTADPAFLLEPINKGEARNLLQKYCAQKPGKYKVGVSLANERDIQAKHLKIVAKICDYMIERYKVDIIFVNMELREGFDESAIRFTTNQMRNKANMLDRRLYHPKEMLGIIGDFDMVLGTRMHFLIFAATVNVPLITISRSPKMDNFARLLHQEPAGWTDNIDFERVKEFVDYTWENREKIKREMKERADIIKEKALLNFKYLGEILEGVYK